MQVGLNLRNEISGHQGGIKELGIHPDGRFFFARSDQMLVLYDLKTGEKITGFYDSAGYDAAMFDPGGGNLLYMSDGRIHYWDMCIWSERMVTAGEIHEYRDVDTHCGVGLKADGNNDGKIEVRRLGSDDLESPEFILEGHKNYIEYVKFFPSGNLLASGSADMTMKFWDIEKREEVSSFKVHNDFVTALAFDKTGKILISGDYSGNIKIWDLTVG